MKIISGEHAIELMRQHTKKDTAFKLEHLTYNRTLKKSNGVRTVEVTMLRPALTDDVFETDSDHYLTYKDIDHDKARQCFKKLIRRVAFAPEFEWYNVNWFLE
jgi:hypothetical protein